ncbi:hypothetical protein SAY87_013313 [Trapa incisa]|uniref:Uncharacterized protein n=1 Tax=Trapa incisa TaxID=236973 RepID=A0AAN7KAV4_9MYRT|nr:hypothetical protein SAY87_013313 [Trapa incisa]
MRRNRRNAADFYTTNTLHEDRGPFVDNYGYDADVDGSSGLPCMKHPGASPVGICAFCLKDRLMKLVCSDCGENRLSSCSCSDELSSNRNSCTVDVGSVGRVSFLIENEKGSTGERKSQNNPNSNTASKARGGAEGGGQSLLDRVVLLKRSGSSCVEIKKSKGIWNIGRLFKKKQKGLLDKNDSKSEIWVADDGRKMGRGAAAVSRSWSLNSFRGFGVIGSKDDGECSFSGARSSISGARASSVSGALLLDLVKKNGFNEAEPRRSAFSEAEWTRSGLSESFPDGHEASAAAAGNIKPNGRVFSLKERDLTDVDDEKGFIDLKFTSSSKDKSCDLLRPDGGGKAAGLLASSKSAFGSTRRMNGSFMGDGAYSSRSCRITVTEWEHKKSSDSRRIFKGWRWAFGQYRPNWISSITKKKDHA